MKHHFVLAIFWILSAVTAGASTKTLTLPHKTATLSNGLRIVLVKYPSPGVVAYQMPLRVGSRNEVEAGKTGFAHFFEHLMFRGTKKRTAEEFGQIYNDLGCENNAWTSDDITNYHGVVASVYLPQILDAEADRFMNLQFDEKALRDESGAVLGEYNKNVAQPEFLLEEKLRSTAFKKHTYSHTTMGFKEDVLQFPERFADVWPFFKRYYRPENVSVILVGDIDFDKMLRLVKDKFGDWKGAADAKPSIIPVEPEQTETRHAEVKLDKPTQTRLTIAYKIPAFTTKNRDFASLELLSAIQFSVTSDFQKEYKFKRKWLDAVDAGALEQADPGLWMINLRLAEAGEGKEAEILAAVDQTVAQVRDHALSAEKIAAAKKRVKNSAVTSWFSSPETLSGRIAWLTTFEPDLDVINRVFERVEETKASDITGFAKRFLTDSRKTVITLRGSSQ